MRIEGLSNLPAAVRTDVADLLGRLDTGDVLKAKVLEITSNEVVLRLFDGSVLKAAAGEDLEAKVGQTLTLTVTSKAEGTLYLETLKNQTQAGSIKPDVLNKLLMSLGLKQNARNQELAAQFLKLGITPSSGQFENALTILKNFSGINAEKAAFLSTKGIQTDGMKPELLVKLLDGDLKLGKQLDELRSIVENLQKNSFGTSVTREAVVHSAKAFLDAAETVLSDKTASSGKVLPNPESNPAIVSSSQKTGMSVIISNAEKASAGSAAGNSRDIASELQEIPNDSTKSTAASQGREKITSASISATPGQKENPPQNRTAFQTFGNEAEISDPQTIPTKDTHGISAQGTSGKDPAALLQEAANTAEGLQSGKGDRSSGVAASDSNTDRVPSGTTSSDPFSKLKDVIQEAFASLDSDKSASGPDLGKSHRELSDKLDQIKNALLTPGIAAHSGSEAVSAAVGQIDDSVRLLNQLNNSSVLYYQLPVHFSGQNATAELFVMKRNQGKKRIDPHDTVMFVSLDTNHMGRFETLIDVKGSNVTINFRTEKPEINDFVKKNIKFLYSGLSESGYKLADIRYALIDSATPPIEMEQVLNRMIETARTKIDTRV